MATDNKQKVLIRSMSVEEIEKYLVNSDLNGKITPKNEDTWHQNYNGVSRRNKGACILSNITNTNENKIFINRALQITSNENFTNYTSKYFTKSSICYISISAYYSSDLTTCFRPLIEYKE